MTPFELIVEYLKAYEALNGAERTPAIRYENGFFIFSFSTNYIRKYRRKQLEKMLGRLREMATA